MNTREIPPMIRRHNLDMIFILQDHRKLPQALLLNIVIYTLSLYWNFAEFSRWCVVTLPIVLQSLKGTQHDNGLCGLLLSIILPLWSRQSEQHTIKCSNRWDKQLASTAYMTIILIRQGSNKGLKTRRLDVAAWRCLADRTSPIQWIKRKLTGMQ